MPHLAIFHMLLLPGAIVLDLLAATGWPAVAMAYLSRTDADFDFAQPYLGTDDRVSPKPHLTIERNDQRLLACCGRF